MKKLLALLLVFLILTLTFTGCMDNNNTSSNPDNASSDISSEDVSSEDGYEEEPVESDEPVDDTLQDNYYEDEDVFIEDEEEPTATPLSPEQQRLENMLAGEDEELNKDSIYNEGNLARLAKAIKKSKEGKEVTLVFYGNSANTGYLLSEAEIDAPYSSIVSDWWTANIGPCSVIKAGIDNLTSITACMRVEHDVISYKPDVVFLDFAIQDGIQAMSKSNALGYDNLIRRILQSESAPAIITLMLTGAEQQSYTMNPMNATKFNSAIKEQKKVAKYYNLPVIDFEQSFWDNSIEVVEVSTKKEKPLINWSTISTDNITMNNDGHMILAGTIRYFLKNVLNKLNKISTKAFAYPTEGYFGNDKYMDISFVSIGDIVEGKKGHSLNLDKAALEANEYSYIASTEKNPTTPHIKTWRHFDYIEGTHKAEWGFYEENPEYLTITLPQAVDSDAYILFGSTEKVGYKTDKLPSGSPIQTPIAVECYDINGNMIGSTLKPAVNYFSEATTLGKSSTAKLPVGTTQVVVKIYAQFGTVYLYGLSYFSK